MEVDIAEVPHIPPKRDKSFYLTLFLAVLPVWGVVPLSWLYVLYNLSHWEQAVYTLHRRPLLIYALCEVRRAFPSSMNSYSHCKLSVTRSCSVFITKFSYIRYLDRLQTPRGIL